METWREGARAGHTHEPNEVTIQLDGLGRQLSELLPEPTAPEGSDGPVFVDESGRRSKSLRRLGWVLAAIFVGYAVTLVVALLGGNSTAPFLPLSGQEEHQKTEEVRTPATEGATPGAAVTPGATSGVSPSTVPQTGGSAAAPGGAVGAGGSSVPGTGSSASARTEPSAQGTAAGASTAGGVPADGTSASATTAASGTPSADPTPPSTDPGADPVTPPVTTPDPPVQEQEGAS
ncbi:hypothetical protein [Streptomyces sp. OR43]|uniref:hypothetical protein n=1 Tax=Streptomyces sp. or43 TaxID=2478957 RepID=UPI0011CE0B65|nr:hypothetical protein [Streptomyces sp. or43]TXS36135.1 hypothetical protein EAO72_21505 [Streptomyces sp. or43]